MTHRYLRIGVLLATSLLAGSVSANETAPPADRTFLEDHRKAIVAAMLAEDADAVTRAYAPDVRLMPEYHATMFGRTDARAYHAAFFEKFSVEAYSRVPVRFFDLDTKVVEVGRFNLRIATGNGAATLLQGKYIDIWDRSGGARKIVTHGWNFDRYPELANELRFPALPGTRTALEARVRVTDSTTFELAALNKLQQSAILQRDDKLWSQFFAPDALLLPNHHPVVNGRVEIDAYLAEHAPQLSAFDDLDIRNDRVDAQGLHVIDYASHVATWRNGDSSGVNTGKNVRIWRRETAGTLRLICQIGMYD